MNPLNPNNQNRLKHLADNFRIIKELDRQIKIVVDRLPDPLETKNRLYEPIRRSLIDLMYQSRCLYLEKVSFDRKSESSPGQ